MVDLDAALFHHFLELPIADRIGHIPADAPQDYLTLKIAAFELNHRAVPLDPFPAIIPQVSAMQSLRQNPSAKVNRTADAVSRCALYRRIPHACSTETWLR